MGRGKVIVDFASGFLPRECFQEGDERYDDTTRWWKSPLRSVLCGSGSSSPNVEKVQQEVFTILLSLINSLSWLCCFPILPWPTRVSVISGTFSHFLEFSAVKFGNIIKQEMCFLQQRFSKSFNGFPIYDRILLISKRMKGRIPPQ